VNKKVYIGVIIEDNEVAECVGSFDENDIEALRVQFYMNHFSSVLDDDYPDHEDRLADGGTEFVKFEKELDRWEIDT
jgi:hypothetical protein